MADEISKAELCQLIVRQLQFFKMEAVASIVAEAAGVPATFEPSSRLTRIATLGLRSEAGSGTTVVEEKREPTVETVEQPSGQLEKDFHLLPGPAPLPVPRFDVRFRVSHKAPVRAIAYSPDGGLVATGSADLSVRVIDATRALNRVEGSDEKVIMRLFHDHTMPINDLAFSPSTGTLATACKDGRIRFFDLNKPQARQAASSIFDACSVRSISYHPSGDYLLAGTDHEFIRLYDIESASCYVPAAANDHHRGSVNQVTFDSSGQLYASCSKDGSIKIWDAVANQCILSIAGAHAATEVFSVAFSKASRYLLSRGRDDAVKLWDCSSGQSVRRYDGARNLTRAPAVFTFTEDYILGGDDSAHSVAVWDTRSARLLTHCTGHTASIKALAANPSRNAFTSGSEDNFVRLWALESMS